MATVYEIASELMVLLTPDSPVAQSGGGVRGIFKHLAEWRTEERCDKYTTPEVIRTWPTTSKKSPRLTLISATLFADYLEWLEAGGHVAPADAVDKTRAQLHDALEALSAERYGPPRYDLEAVGNTDEAYVGAYGLIRRESANNTIYRELLVLNFGEKKRRTATYVNQSTVCRGNWHVLQQAIYCTLFGLSREDRANIIQIALERENEVGIMGGMVSGTKTQRGQPICMPLLAVRIEGASEDVLSLGNRGDAYILKHYKAEPYDSPPNLVESLEQRLFKPLELGNHGLGAFLAELRHEFPDTRTLLSTKLRSLGR